MMFLRRPSPSAIDRFLRESRDLSLSYGPVGIANDARAVGAERGTGRRVDEHVVTIGRGARDFARAYAALVAWTPFDIGWVELFPRHAPIHPGTVVGVLIHHLGIWSLNGCRVVYTLGDDRSRFGFAYGTLTNHEEAGEELFEVSLDPHTDEVRYRIRAISWPYAAIAHAAQPIVRVLQRRFRHDSALAMQRAVAAREKPEEGPSLQ
jgi:uncharacterized protein (UPF0548 family)